MFLDVCNTSFLTKQCPQSCIQNYWHMFMMIFCPILVVHVNSCLRLNFFSSFSSSLTSPHLPHLPPLLRVSSPHLLPLSLSMLPSPSLPHPPLPPSLTSPSSALPHFPSPPLPHLSLSISTSPSLSVSPSSSLTSPSPSLLQPSFPFFYFNRLCQPCVCGGGRTCM